MKTAAAIGLAMLAGCAVSPAEVQITGEQFISSHVTSAAVTAQCIIEHIDRTEPSYVGRSYPSKDHPGAIEIIVRLLGMDPNTAAVVTINSAAAGAIAEWRLSPVFLTSSGRADVFARLKGSC